MKKNYIIPAIETLEIRSAFVICSDSVGGDERLDGINPAPKKRNKPF